MRQTATEEQIRERTEKLVANPRHFLDVCDHSGQWSGPSVYFHRRALEQRDRHTVPSAAVGDQLFLEYLYATLCAWGLHRMGPPSGRLLDFPEFRQRLQACTREMDSVVNLVIETVAPRKVTNTLWSLVERLCLRPVEGPGIVVASKALHHLLPNLVPPIDRRYTLAFFRWENRFNMTPPKTVFEDVFPRLVSLANAIKPKIAGYKSRVFSSSLPKLVDNAIVGFMLEQNGRLVQE